jgi:hypothetical protein
MMVDTTSYPYYVGFIMKQPATSLLTTVTVSVSTTKQTSFLLGLLTNGLTLLNLIDTSVPLNSNLKQVTAISSTPLLDTDIQTLPDNFKTVPAAGSITPVTIPAKTYNVGDPQLSFTFADFTYSVTCSDIDWTYTATLADGSTLPTFIQVNTLASGG